MRERAHPPYIEPLRVIGAVFLFRRSSAHAQSARRTAQDKRRTRGGMFTLYRHERHTGAHRLYIAAVFIAILNSDIGRAKTLEC